MKKKPEKSQNGENENVIKFVENPKKLMIYWVLAKFGKKAAINFAIIITLIFIIISFLSYTGKTKVVMSFFEETLSRIPKADAGRFSVMVVNIENDVDTNFKRLIIESLKEIKYIQVLSCNKNILLDGLIPEEKVKIGYLKAHKILKKSRASVLIWGTLIKHSGKVIPKLYWTSSIGEYKPSRYILANENELRLPQVFWTDLKKILCLLIIKEFSSYTNNSKQEIYMQFIPFVSRVKNLLEVASPELGWNQDSILETKHILALSLMQIGNGKNNIKLLEESIDIFEYLLKKYSLEKFPEKWASAQSHIACAFICLGVIKSESSHLKRAIYASMEALKVFTKDKYSSFWTSTCYNLGKIYFLLGRLEKKSLFLEKAIELYRNLLPIYSSKSDISEWANLQFNIGEAFREMDFEKNNNSNLKSAVEAYQNALYYFSPKQDQNKYALIKNNLGVIWIILGTSNKNDQLLRKAIQSFRESIDAENLDKNSIEWADSQRKLGFLLYTRGLKENKSLLINEAVVCFRNALNIYSFEGSKDDWIELIGQLSDTLFWIANFERKSEIYDDSIHLLEKALKKISIENDSKNYAKLAIQLGGKFELLCFSRKNIQMGELAIKYYREVIQIYSMKNEKKKRADFQFRIGKVFKLIGTIKEINIQNPNKTDRINNLGGSIQAFRVASKVFSKENDPKKWGEIQSNIGEMLILCYSIDNKTNKLNESIKASKEALQVYSIHITPLEFAQNQERLGMGLLFLGLREKKIEKIEGSIVAYNKALEGYNKINDKLRMEYVKKQIIFIQEIQEKFKKNIYPRGININFF